MYLAFQADVVWAVWVAAVAVLVLMPVHAAVRQAGDDSGSESSARFVSRLAFATEAGTPDQLLGGSTLGRVHG